MQPTVTTYLPVPPPLVEFDDVVPARVSWQRSDPTSATDYLRYFEDEDKLCLDLSLEVPTGTARPCPSSTTLPPRGPSRPRTMFWLG